MKKTFALILALCMMLSLFAGCAKTSTESAPAAAPAAENNAAEPAQEAAEEKPAASEEKPTLYVANWQGYCSDQPYAELAFEEQFNCNVEHVYFNSLEELFTTLQTGGMGNIDAAVTTSNYTKSYVDAGLFEAIDLSLCKNYADIDEAYLCKDTAYDAAGNCYGIPWVWSLDNLGYNADIVGRELDSWKDIWDDEFAGKVGLGDDYVIVIMLTALSLGMEPTSPENIDLKAVEDALVALKPNINVIWSSYDGFISPYKAGEIVIGDPWPGMATTLANSGENIRFISPKEGSIGSCDLWSVVKGSKNYDLACAWCDFMAGVEFQTAMATSEGNAHNPVNVKVIETLTDEQKAVLWCNPMPEKIYMMLALDEQQKAEWSELWEYIKAN